MATVQVDPRHDEVRKAVLQGLIAFNNSAAGAGDRQDLCVSVTEDGSIVGGAIGRFWHGWVYVDLLWISEGLRGRDLGTQVMDEIEAHAASLGARGVHLTTYSWQARPFYERRGYTVFGELSPYPEGHACYWLSKRLSNDTQPDQGNS